ncbi:secreted protein [Puccinia sorghi]|uniref:Secreted protein n=1 Tax=Puccinia sorghi TaxID=27349 RepID=A0A0L6USR4_9BASI|nr:secreted protein [Puccinia sorghi]
MSWLVVGQQQTKAGPHGRLVQPEGGKQVRSVDGLGTLRVSFAKYHGNDGQTIAIDVRLRPIDDDQNRTTYMLATGLTSSRNNSTIDLLFTSRWACGNYKLVIIEHQLHKGVHIAFQVAAPRIKITCLPLPLNDIVFSPPAS